MQLIWSCAPCCRAVYELWGEGRCVSELKASVRGVPDARKAPYLRDDVTFKFVVDTFNMSLSGEKKVARIDVSAERSPH